MLVEMLICPSIWANFDTNECLVAWQMESIHQRHLTMVTNGLWEQGGIDFSQRSHFNEKNLKGAR